MSLVCKNKVLSNEGTNFYQSSKVQVLQIVIKVTGEN